MTLNQEFLDFLERTPSALAKFFDVLHEFHKLQGQIDEVEGDVTGPKRFRIGDRVDVQQGIDPIGREELDAISKGMAEAHVKEKALSWIKGFIAGVAL